MSPPSTRSSSTLSVTFWGAAQSVTGSMHLVEAAGHKVLLDCGATRWRREHGILGQPLFPFEPSDIDAVILTHAHSDHCGNLPALVRHGFRGPIYCTPATRDLIALMLHHSARFEEDQAHVHSVIGLPQTAEARPERTRGDVDQALDQCVTLPYSEPGEVLPGIEVRLVNAGHILGSAMVALTAAAGARTVRLTFTGDLGRRGAPLGGGPEPVPSSDLLISESTYGGRVLDSPAAAAAKFEEVVRRTIARQGKVIIPAFSLGRTQVVVHALQQAMAGGRLPEVPVYVDSPVASKLAEVYRRHLAAPGAAVDGDPLVGKVCYIRGAEESNEISAGTSPCVIVAPGGMCEGGRIVQHLKQHIDDPRCSVVLVNYQAPHTPGRQLLERGPTVRFHGRKWNKWADVVYLAGFSGHGDRDDLLASLSPLAGPATKVCLVHGEVEQANALAGALRGCGFGEVQVPGRGHTVFI